MVCSNFWKLDKVDKIVTSLIFIIFTVNCVFKTFVFASDVPSDYYEISQTVVANNTFINGIGTVNTSALGATVYKVDLLNGANYILLHGGKYFSYVLSNDEFESTSFFEGVSLIDNGDSSEIYIYNNGDFDYLYLSYYSDNNVNVYTNANGMVSAISDLTNFVSSDNLWEIFNKAIPYISIVVLVGFGVFIIFKLIKKISKGRAF